MIPTAQAPSRSAAWFAPDLLAGSPEGLLATSTAFASAVGAALAASRPAGPLPTGAPADVLRSAAEALGPPALPRTGIGQEAALHRLARVLVGHGVDLAHPLAAAHLQPPPLTVAVAADALASAGNASLDTYDSGPATLAVERWVVAALAGLAGLGERADGVLTPGGSLSNLLALLLARDAAATRLGLDVRRHGVAALPRPVVLCSELAHFSVHRACAALGLGESAVRPVPVDGRGRMRPEVVRALLHRLDGKHTPLAVVATAGTTDFGAVDPLPQLAEVAAEHGVWLHVDAAYGFGALFSERLADRLAGLELADSVTVDLHKLGWQPAAASVLLTADTTAFAALDREVAYLNPADDAAAGYDGLLGRSLQTTRRPDAVKVAATLLAHGRHGLGRMVDACHALALHAQRRISAEPELELVAPAELTTVVFRYRATSPDGHDAALDDEVNGALRRLLAESGRALVGRTTVRPAGPDSPRRVCLKFTLLNPTATAEDVDALVDAVLEAARACRAERVPGAPAEPEVMAEAASAHATDTSLTDSDPKNSDLTNSDPADADLTSSDLTNEEGAA
ncbi:pyridoxal phosphate-dependent decarboxylase family protein [Streptoalloteichus hindustanus]|uniref:L-2,4-diaminobutyrate decarboxylase n=1 Tax=Streptoalloteichus hindustanus TaxID=2017 RepID=A0A1M5HDC6_STRHI|nr:pyridoxal-dependent decarboxylase [Streptoalloteichus hindustanus]SHG13888.1 L-2,4-diaminobutyrate decarboxylase [Streptoalloteichus hindustanus]